MKRRGMWLGLLILSFLLLVKCLPYKLQFEYTSISAVFGSLLITILMIQLFGDFKSFNEFNHDTSALKGKWFRKITVLSGIFFFAFLFIFIHLFLSAKEKDLLKNGIVAEAVVSDRDRYVSSRGKWRTHYQHDVILDFQTESGAVCYTISTTEEEFDCVNENQRVDIIYSSKFPSNIELLMSDEKIRMFTENSCRNISTSDLKLMHQLNVKQITGYLRQVHLNWKRMNESTWQNANKNSIIKLDAHLSYLFPLDQNEALISEIQQKCISNELENEKQIYQFEEYRITTKQVSKGRNKFNLLEIYKN